jgi:hypothetical protein
MIVEEHDKYKIKLIQTESGYGVSYAYEVLENNNLFCRALTLKQARQEINCSSPSKEISLEKTALIENCIKNITYCSQFTTELVKALRISLNYVPNNVILDISEDAFFLSKKENKK